MQNSFFKHNSVNNDQIRPIKYQNLYFQGQGMQQKQF